MINAVRLAGLYLVAGGALGAGAALVGVGVIHVNAPRDVLPATLTVCQEASRRPRSGHADHPHRPAAPPQPRQFPRIAYPRVASSCPLHPHPRPPEPLVT